MKELKCDQMCLAAAFQACSIESGALDGFDVESLLGYSGDVPIGDLQEAAENARAARWERWCQS